MPFVKGAARPANAGKKKGSKHRTTVIKNRLHLDSWKNLAAFIEGPGLKRYIKELDALSGKDYTTAFNTIAEYVKPKLSRQEHTGQIQSVNYNVDLTKKEIEEITKSFDNDY